MVRIACRAQFVTMLKQNKIKLPKNSASIIIKNNDAGLIALYVGLKSYAIGGCITNYKNQIPALSKYLGCSERTTKNHIKKLIKENLAWVWGINLRLAAKDEIAKRYSICSEKYDEYTFFDYRTTKDEFRQKAIQDSLYVQHSIEKSNLNNEIKKKKLANGESSRYRMIRRAVNEESFNGIDINARLSQRGIAKLYGSKYASTGQYWERKLQKRKMIEVKKQDHILIHANVTKEFYWKLVNANPEYPIIYRNGNIYKPQCNLIRVIQ